MVACEPSDSVLAALLQMNDDLLAAVSSWERTKPRLAMQQSRSAAPSTHSQGSASSSRVASNAPELSDSSASSASDLVPTPVALGGLFWSSTNAARPTQLTQAPAQQLPQQQQQQQQREQLYPSIFTSSAGDVQNRDTTARQGQGLGQASSSGSYLDDLAGLQPQYPHQTLSPAHQAHTDDATWQAFVAGAGVPSVLPSELRGASASRQAEVASRAQPAQEFHGTVLSYKLAEPQQTAQSPQEEESSLNSASGELQGHADGSASWFDEPAERHANGQLADTVGQESFDPFAGKQGHQCILTLLCTSVFSMHYCHGLMQCTLRPAGAPPLRECMTAVGASGRHWEASTPDSPFRASASIGNPFDTPQLGSLQIPPSANAPAATALTGRQNSGSSSQAGPSSTDMPKPLSDPNPVTLAGLWSHQGPLSSRQPSSTNMGSRAPSVPLAQASSSHSLPSMPMTQSLSNQSLVSFASGSIAANKGRSPSPVLELGQDAFAQSSSQGLTSASAGVVEQRLRSEGRGGEAEVSSGQIGEVEQRQQLQRMTAQHAEEVKRLNENHAAHVAGIQSQAVAKMKELIEKVFIASVKAVLYLVQS